MQSVLHLCAQGTEDLEEVLSERLQQLPPPLSVHGGGASPIREEGGQDVQPGDELPAEPSKARPLSLSPLSRIGINLCALSVAVHTFLPTVLTSGCCELCVQPVLVSWHVSFEAAMSACLSQ